MIAPASASRGASGSATNPILERLIESLTDRLQAGESINLEEFISQHPDQAEQLRQLLPALEVLADLGRSAARRVPLGPEAGPEIGELGDYRIIREVGRGGMGVVYEARQISLNRRVALKVLPFAAALDPRQLQRFHNEAQAAAGLHHTHIVPVFAVGVERGVHYYAMQFIEGETLASIIGELREIEERDRADRTESKETAPSVASRLAGGGLAPPEPSRVGRGSPDPAPNTTEGLQLSRTAPATAAPASGPLSSTSNRTSAFFRTVAALAVQAAEALEHAHSLGIVHRDIKPANLLLDTRGDLWVTDFGLAQVQAEAGLTLTLTGDVLGTLRYMSPEQALGRRALVDHRSDIYSLGETLYELLTLRPAIEGSDRQEILRRIAFEEPSGLREHNPALPRELETIVLKAMSKEAEGRYPTAQELAEDLQRFLEHKPIRARRPSLMERAAKWARRHTAVVASGLMLLVLSVIGFALATLLIWREQGRTQRAYQAEAQLRQKARKAVDEMYRQVTQQLLIEKPDVEKVRREFLEKALAYYRDFAVTPDADPAARHEAARALLRVGDIERELVGAPEAEGAYRQAIALLDDLTGHYPDEPAYRDDLARCHEVLGFALSNAHRLLEAERSYRRGLALAERLAADFPQEPGYQRRVASLCINLGTVLHQTARFQELDVLLRRARDRLARLVQTFPQDTLPKRELATINNNLAALHIDIGRWEEAEDEIRAAIGLYRERSAEHPDDLEERANLANSYANLSELRLHLGPLREGEESIRKSLALAEQLVKDFPNLFYLPHAVGGFDRQLGRILKAEGRFGEAEQAFRRTLAIAEKSVADKPGGTDGLLGLAQVCGDLGGLLRETGKSLQSREYFRRAREISERMISFLPNSAEKHTTFSLLLADWPDPQLRDPARAVKLARVAVDQSPHTVAAWDALGIALYRAGSAKEAIQPLRRSVEMTSGGAVEIWFFLAMALSRTGDEDQARIWYDKATDWTAKKRPKDPELLRLRTEAAALLGLSDASKPADKEKTHSK
jgi:serine/threonine protein kinase/tetratricopeptide (TPR) repeat protein